MYNVSLKSRDRSSLLGSGKMVGARGLEPPTSASRTLRATKLRYAPQLFYYRMKDS